MNFIQKNKWVFVGVVLGAIGGYAYYHYVGCSSGSCAITSKPLNSTLYGTVMGGLLFSMIPVKKSESNK